MVSWRATDYKSKQRRQKTVQLNFQYYVFPPIFFAQNQSSQLHLTWLAMVRSFWQLSILISTRMSRICRICSTALTRILDQQSCGILLVPFAIWSILEKSLYIILFPSFRVIVWEIVANQSLWQWLLGRKLTKSLCDVIEDFGLVSFTTLNIQVGCLLHLRFLHGSTGAYCDGCDILKIFYQSLKLNFFEDGAIKLYWLSVSWMLRQDKDSVVDLVRMVDKSNGYVFAGMEGNIDAYHKVAARPTSWDYERYPCRQQYWNW